MFNLALPLMAFVLLKIAQEDWKERAVRFYWFITLFILLAWVNMEKIGVSTFLTQYFRNVIFIAVQLLLVNLYFCLRHRRMFWIFDRYLGWGDVVFLLSIAGAWNLGGFLLFFIGSLLLILIFALVYLQKQQRSIPLAGLQALLFMGCYMLDHFKYLSLDGILPY